MTALLIVVAAIVLLFIGYVFYGSWLAKQWGIDPTKKTPAIEKEDGVDYVAAKPAVLMGHHFSSIAGAGPIGCMAAAIVKFSGARHVVVTDMNPYRLELAKKLGATRTVNLKEENLKDVMKEIGMAEGFDVGLEMSGSQVALDDMIHNMKHGGHIALLGLQRTDAKVDLETVIFNGLHLKGIYGRKVWDTWYKMSTMLQAGLDISDIITHHFDIKDFQKGFDAMISGNSGKVILDWAHVND